MTPEIYGITYIPTQLTFAGCRIAVMRHYGFTALFKKRESADRYARKIFGSFHSKLSVKLMAGQYCLSLVRNVVEVFSGRLEVCIVDGLADFYLKNPRRPSYNDLYEGLLGGRNREIQARIKKERSLFGTALDFAS